MRDKTLIYSPLTNGLWKMVLTESDMQSNKQLAAGQKRKLQRIQREIYAMSVEWEDRDNYCLDNLTEAADNIEKLYHILQVDNEY